MTADLARTWIDLMLLATLLCYGTTVGLTTDVFRGLLERRRARSRRRAQLARIRAYGARR